MQRYISTLDRLEKTLAGLPTQGGHQSSHISSKAYCIVDTAHGGNTDIVSPTAQDMEGKVSTSDTRRKQPASYPSSAAKHDNIIRNNVPGDYQGRRNRREGSKGAVRVVSDEHCRTSALIGPRTVNRESGSEAANQQPLLVLGRLGE